MKARPPSKKTAASPTKKKSAAAPAIKTASCRPLLERLSRILSLLDSHKNLTRRKIAEELEVTIKTVQRDMNFLRDNWGVPVGYDSQRMSYVLTGAIPALPCIDLSQGELLSLLITGRALQELQGTPFERPVRNAFDKLANSLPGQVSLAQDMRGTISFREFGFDPHQLKAFAPLAEAVRTGNRVELNYLKGEELFSSYRKVEPAHLVCAQGQWYCLAYDLDRQEVRTFALARIKKVETLKEKSSHIANFSGEDYMKNSFGIFRSGELYEVEAIFDPCVVNLVKDRRWHPQQKTKILADGTLQMTVTVDGLDGIEYWLLSWGEYVEVKHPRELRKRMRAHMNAGMRVYGGKAGKS